MITSFVENLATILVGAVVLAILVLTVAYMDWEKKKAARCGGCCVCSQAGKCHGEDAILSKSGISREMLPKGGERYDRE